LNSICESYTYIVFVWTSASLVLPRFSY